MIYSFASLSEGNWVWSLFVLRNGGINEWLKLLDICDPLYIFPVDRWNAIGFLAWCFHYVLIFLIEEYRVLQIRFLQIAVPFWNYNEKNVGDIITYMILISNLEGGLLDVLSNFSVMFYVVSERDLIHIVL